MPLFCLLIVFFFHDMPTTEIYTLSLHELFRSERTIKKPPRFGGMKTYNWEGVNPDGYFLDKLEPIPSALPSFQKLPSGLTPSQDRKSGSAGMPRPISYAVFCLKKKTKNKKIKSET